MPLTPNGDGNVAGDDFLVWQRNFPYPAALSSVPEPNSLVLLAIGDWRFADAEASQNISKSYESFWTFGLLRTGPLYFLYQRNKIPVRLSQ